MLNQPKSPPLPQNSSAKVSQKSGGEGATDNRMDQIQALLLGNTQDEMSDRIDHLGDRFSDFEQFVRGEFRKVADWIVEVVDGLAANGPEANAEVEAKVRAEAEALCDKFPMYPNR